MWLDTQRVDSFTLSSPARVIYLKERSFAMLKKDLILRNPLQRIGCGSTDILPKGGFGAVLARAGVGKTSLMVQLSLNSLLQSKNVLHISLVDPVRKVDLWYEEVFRHIALQYHLDKTDELWESILPHRFIMTFKVEGFSVPKLEERLTDLTEQGIFFPDLILIDGLPFDENARQQLMDLKSLATAYGVNVWFSVRTHRCEGGQDNVIPLEIQEISELIELALFLHPQGDEIQVKVVKGYPSDSPPPALYLDPSTMLVKGYD